MYYPRNVFNSNCKVGEHARLGRCWVRLAPSGLRVKLARTLEAFRCVRVFREGAENNIRGGRAPISISEFRLNRMIMFAALALAPLAVSAQTLTITNGVQKYASLASTTVNHERPLRIVGDECHHAAFRLHDQFEFR